MFPLYRNKSVLRFLRLLQINLTKGHNAEYLLRQQFYSFWRSNMNFYFTNDGESWFICLLFGFCCFLFFFSSLFIRLDISFKFKFLLKLYVERLKISDVIVPVFASTSVYASFCFFIRTLHLLLSLFTKNLANFLRIFAWYSEKFSKYSENKVQ